jgi:hypothetical protein
MYKFCISREILQKNELMFQYSKVCVQIFKVVTLQDQLKLISVSISVLRIGSG